MNKHDHERQYDLAADHLVFGFSVLGITGLLTILAISVLTKPSDAAGRPYKELCREVRYELAQQVEEGLLDASRAESINKRCQHYANQEQEKENKRPWWE